MDKKLKKIWVAKLKSGRYRQGRDRLRSNDNKYCCLGVLCSAINPKGWSKDFGYTAALGMRELDRESGRYSWRNGKKGNSVDIYFSQSGDKSILKMVGLSKKQESSLIGMNDKGKTFEEIAAYIERKDISMIDDRDWFTLDGENIDLKEEIFQLARQGEKVIIIGTDSQKFDKKIDFVTVVVVYTPYKGGRVFYTRERDIKTYNLRDKLIKEALLSIQVAWALSPILPENCQITALHADVNSDITAGESAKFEKEIAGMISGNGFTVVTKPLGWAASHVAEHIVKNRHEGRYEIHSKRPHSGVEQDRRHL